jgi:hypothetical protein
MRELADKVVVVVGIHDPHVLAWVEANWRGCVQRPSVDKAVTKLTAWPAKKSRQEEKRGNVIIEGQS